eukprot:TRINITY_DN7106_c0_g1_i3.p1 TRINITY_DN7106_c0_g1~~TRINITY_DN7106_c0_g1_i3.p1  ORF type:complete len:143 (+),score=18.04 TRINITY_DN7106_c0_g1_i3:534-962(+)
MASAARGRPRKTIPAQLEPFQAFAELSVDDFRVFKRERKSSFSASEWQRIMALRRRALNRKHQYKHQSKRKGKCKAGLLTSTETDATGHDKSQFVPIPSIAFVLEHFKEDCQKLCRSTAAPIEPSNEPTSKAYKTSPSKMPS